MVFDILNLFINRLSKKTIFVFDIIFFTLVGFFDFCLFLVFCNGEIRGFIFAGEILGFLLCRITLSKAYIPVALIILRFIKGAFLGGKTTCLRIFNKISKKAK